MKILLLVLLGILFAFEADSNAVACDIITQNPVPLTTPIKVELDIFSGREAPIWSLSANEGKTLLQMIGSLSTTEPVEFRENLGYRGLIVKLPDSLSGAIATLKAHNGIIRYETGNQIKFFTDTDRSVERLLVISAKPRISPDLYNLLLKESGLSN
jgi:hypothetical protein